MREPARQPRRRLPRDARRSELLLAAISVLKEQGPAGVRVEDITRAAGTAKGTFYLYFDSWEDLLAAVRDHIVLSYADDVRSRLAKVTPLPWTFIEDECVCFVDFVVGLGDLHEVIFHGPAAGQPARTRLSSLPLIVEMLQAGIEAGACRVVDTARTASLLFSILHTTADGIADADGRATSIAMLRDLLRRWLRNEPVLPRRSPR